MDPISSKTVFGAAGGGGAQSYAVNVQYYAHSYLDSGMPIAYDPTTERTAVVSYATSFGSNYPSVEVWDKDWNLVFNKVYYSGSLGSWGFLACTFDSSGNLYITGSATATGYNTPLVKLDSNYNLTTAVGGIFYTTSYAWGVASDNSNLYFASSIGTDGKLILTKTNLSGSQIWNKELTNSFNNGYPPHKVLVKNSNVYVFGQGWRTSSNNMSAWVSKWDASTGSRTWTLSTGSQWAQMQGGYVDNSGNVYGAGFTNYYGIVVKINSSGTHLWNRRFTNQYQYFFDATVDEATGDVYAIGQGQAASGSAGLVLVKFDSSGTLQWQRTIRLFNVSNNQYSVGATSSAQIAIQPNGLIRIHTTHYCTVQGFRIRSFIEYDPTTAPTGSWTDPYAYGGSITYRWDIAASNYTFVNNAETFASDSTTVSNTSNSFTALPALSALNYTLNKYGTTLLT